MNILQTIFNDHYEEMLYILHPRQAVIDNVDKMINCGDPAFGGAMYACSKCGNLKFVPFRCRRDFVFLKEGPIRFSNSFRRAVWKDLRRRV